VVFVPGYLFEADPIGLLLGRGEESALPEEVQEGDWNRLEVTFAGGTYTLRCTAYVVHADGSCWGSRFSFHARGGRWRFETEGPFSRWGYVGRGVAGVMGVQWATRVLARCLLEFRFLASRKGS
jgi:hypothetical protein